MTAIGVFLAYMAFVLWVLYQKRGARIFEAGSIVYLFASTFVVGFGVHWIIGLVIWAVVLYAVAIVRFESLRQWIAGQLYKRASKSIPTLSQTEEEALNAGEPWLERSLFLGEPDWNAMDQVKTELTKEEQAFLDNETNTLCAMIDDWEVTKSGDLPKPVWDYIKEKGFLGLVIDKKYGGKGFSARAHSDIVAKIASRCSVAAVTVMVPNSLGPAELLHHYGSEEQKKQYLPNLAKGIDIPCFALTEPGAGSDATSLQSEAIVMHKKVDGKKVLGLNITLNKRWITLAPVATLIGLAVNLKDPEGLLNGEGKEGITCLLIPRDTANLEIGNRHLPAEQPFMNGTIRGHNIFVPISNIIGGQKHAGYGWQMLVECLAIGRSISLPALGACSSSVSYLTTGAFARIRRQFNVDIAQFEGIQEKLAGIAGLNYMVNATRLMTIAAVQLHKKPSVASAMTKYFNTELARAVINDAMDVHAGRTVVVGPRNYLSNYYQGIPISVTVEGANIMSRNLLIFGQGSMACHPYIRDEFYAISRQDKAAFGTLIWNHIYYFARNTAKMITSGWTLGRLISTPKSKLAWAYRDVTQLSHAFSAIADISLMVLGGSLKRRERLSARLADAWSHLYIAMACLYLCKANEEQDDYVAHTTWAVQYCLHRSQKAMIDFLRNFPNRWIGWKFRALAFPFGQTMKAPSDIQDAKMSRLMTTNNAYRDFLKSMVFLTGNPNEPIDRMEHAFQLLMEHEGLYKKISHLKRFKFSQLKDKLQEEVDAGHITAEEKDILIQMERARWDAEQVDEFPSDALNQKAYAPVQEGILNPLD